MRAATPGSVVLRILIVDDTPESLAQWSGLLEDAGHQVVPLAVHRNAPPPEVPAGPFDLAFVDRRLRGDDWPDDDSGTDYATEVARSGIPTVLLTAFPPEPTGSALAGAPGHIAVRLGNIACIWRKQLHPSERRTCVNQFARTRRVPNGLASVVWEDQKKGLLIKDPLDAWSAVLAALSLPDGSGVEWPELAALFRSLLPPCAWQVVLEPVAAGKSGTALVKMTVCYADNDISEELAVKFGPHYLTRPESVAYDRGIGPLPDGTGAQLRWRAETEHLGAIAYSWVQDGIEAGREYKAVFREATATPGTGRSGREQLRNSLGRLFGVQLAPWYQGVARRQRENPDPATGLLCSLYQGPELWPMKGGFVAAWDGIRTFAERIVDTPGDRWSFRDYPYLGDLVNPLSWAEAYGQRAPSMLAAVHGDLHAKNVYIMPDRSVRLIDFGKTGSGHAYRDFACLDVSVRFACLAPLPDGDRLPLGLRVALEQVVSGTRSLADTIDSRFDSRQAQIELERIVEAAKAAGMSDTTAKAWRATAHCGMEEAALTTTAIRRAAMDAVGYLDGEAFGQYQYAVVMHLLRVAAGVDDAASGKRGEDTPDDVRTHALIGAALAAQAADGAGG